MADRLILGCGYVGREVALRWLNRGDRVFAVTRSEDRAQELCGQGILPICWNWYEDFSGNVELSECSTVLISVSHAAQPHLPAAETHVAGLERLVNSSLGSSLRSAKWIYLSTTGVYGETGDSDWVDENSPCSPSRPGSVAAWAAEQWIQQRIQPLQHLILRPAGIYGPGRVPNWKNIRDATPLAIDPDSYLNLVHVTDLAECIVEMADRACQHELYCLSDGSPATRGEYYSFIAELGGWPQPVFSQDSSTLPTSSRKSGNKRVCSERLHREISYRFQYPTYREGLRHILHEFLEKDS